MRSLFCSPHNDDESLFGAYIIQAYKPLVLVITDSYIQFNRGTGITPEQRREETQNAMNILGAEVKFLRIRDDNFTDDIFRVCMTPYVGFDTVFAPAIECGNPIHDAVGRVADEIFPNVHHYSTYTKTREYPAGDIEIEATGKMQAMKLRALECYKSQINLGSTRQYFTTPNKREFLCTTRCSG